MAHSSVHFSTFETGGGKLHKWHRVCFIDTNAEVGEDGAQLGALRLGDHIIDRCRVQLILARELFSNSTDELAGLT